MVPAREKEQLLKHRDAWGGGWGLGAYSQGQTGRGVTWASFQNSSRTRTAALTLHSYSLLGAKWDGARGSGMLDLADSRADRLAEGCPSSLPASASASLTAHLVVISLLISTSSRS